jgi:8-oxo-dGTP pyrophosphatase MutT (NUDIX family)
MCLRLRAVTTSASLDLKSYTGAILRDQAGRLLMVEPTYKEPWEIPGVVIEALESPLSTVVRELQEELGIRFHASEFSLILHPPVPPSPGTPYFFAAVRAPHRTSEIVSVTW